MVGWSQVSGRLRAGSDPSLRGAWRAMLLKLFAVIVGVIVVAVGLSQRELDRFSTTLSEVRGETAALAALDRAVLESAGPMTVVLYRVGTEEQRAEARAAYDAASTAVADAFDAARAALRTDHELSLLDQAEATWDGIDATVVSSTSTWSDQALGLEFAAGRDPFRVPVWDAYMVLDRQQADILTAAVDDMQGTSTAAELEHRSVLALFAVALLVAVVLAVSASRRLARRVREPLEELCAASARLPGLEGDAPIELPEAVVEIRELAAALDDSARSLRRSTGLLRSQAYLDALTSLPNRKAFAEALQSAIGDGATEPAAVLFIDLDDFKDVNDTQGHAAGDALLRVVASRLRGAVRDSDLVARLGGDEFAVLTRVPDEGHAARVAERILDTIRHPVHLDGQEVFVGCSIGIATHDPGMTAADADELLAGADFAMYMAKGQGKNRYELHSPDLHAEMLGRAELRRDIAGALSERQLVLHYQPIVDLASERVIGYEALLRWQHPTRGLLPPADFIGVAEDTGAIVHIGAWVIEEACRTAAELHRHDPALLMSVNVSARQLSAEGFELHACQATSRHGVPADRLILEITEETAILNTSSEIETLTNLRSHGFHVALDDFGTGFSSLRYLGELPADILKIDRSFVTAEKASMFESIVGLAQRLGLQVIAEGIEDPGDLERLRSYGEMAGQGYLFGRPVPADELPTSAAIPRPGAPSAA